MNEMKIKSRFIGESGQSLVELVIVLPLLLIILASVIDVGRAMQTYIVMLNASREAAMHGAATQVDTATLHGVVINELARGGVNASAARVTIEYQLRGFPPENHILVRVDYTLPLFLAVLSFETIDLRCRTEMIAFW
jgi:Flp pilus assembly protein TadG